MELNKKQKTIKYAIYAAIILLLDLIQNVSGLFPEIAGSRCLLLIPAVVFLSLGEDPFIGAGIGFFAGLLWDLTGAVHMGFNCFFLLMICFLCSCSTTYIARDIFATNVILSSCATVLYCFIYWLFFILIKGVDGGELTLVTFYLPTMIYTIIISLILWLIINPIKNKLNHAKNEES